MRTADVDRLRYLEADTEKIVSAAEALLNRTNRAEKALERLRDGIGKRNMNRPVEDLICLRCGAQNAVHDADEEHPGVFRCRECHEGICA